MNAFRARSRPLATAQRRILPVLLACIVLSASGAGCEDDMADQPRYNTLAPSPFFDDGQASRPIPAGTVARGHLRTDSHLFEGMVNGQPAETYPFPVTRERLIRGQQRYEIFCAVCHGSLGDGNGMIVQRGFTRPPAFYPLPLHEQQMPLLYAREQYLMIAPVGHYFNVITNGWGAMFSYNDRISPEDRWNLIMYIRALQISQTATIEDVPAEQRAALQGQRQPSQPFPPPQPPQADQETAR
jgi:mono/diheme cytochrome c family protein